MSEGSKILRGLRNLAGLSMRYFWVLIFHSKLNDDLSVVLEDYIAVFCYLGHEPFNLDFRR